MSVSSFANQENMAAVDCENWTFITPNVSYADSDYIYHVVDTHESHQFHNFIENDGHTNCVISGQNLQPKDYEPEVHITSELKSAFSHNPTKDEKKIIENDTLMVEVDAKNCDFPNDALVLSQSKGDEEIKRKLEVSLKEDKKFVDPVDLLDELSPSLENNGGLKENRDIVGRMKICFSMPMQCIMINIIRSSRELVIKKLLSLGAWDLLYDWLKEAKSQINKPLLLELLQLYKLLPVSTKLLKTNSCAKEIKQLCKNPDDRIARLAKVIVEEWMNKVKSSGIKNSSGKKNSDKGKATEKFVSPKEKAANPNMKSTKPNVQSDEQAKRERPKTVKIMPSKFRITGLEEEKSTSFNGVLSKKNLNEKKTAVTVLKTLNTTKIENKASKNKISNKFLSSEGGDKSFFMKALQNSSVSMQKKKRKFPISSSTSSSSSLTLITSTSVTCSPSSSSSSKSLNSPLDFQEKKILDNFSFYKEIDLELNKEETKQNFEDTENKSLNPAKKLKKKKSVTWAKDLNLCNYHFFELDPNERCNVNNPKPVKTPINETFNDHRRHEFEMEKQLLFGKILKVRTENDFMKELIKWKTPELLDDVSPFQAGSESKERGIQAERETKVLQVIYFHRELIPDSPSEPEMDWGLEVMDQGYRIIPLEDTEDVETMDKDNQENLNNINYNNTTYNSLPPVLTNLIENAMNNKNIKNNNYFSQQSYQQTENYNYNNYNTNNYDHPHKNHSAYDNYSPNDLNSSPAYPMNFNNQSNYENRSYGFNNYNNSYNNNFQNNSSNNNQNNKKNSYRNYKNNNSNNISRNKKFNKASHDNELCWFHQSGKCVFGDKCKKSHSSPKL